MTFSTDIPDSPKAETLAGCLNILGDEIKKLSGNAQVKFITLRDIIAEQFQLEEHEEEETPGEKYAGANDDI